MADPNSSSSGPSLEPRVAVLEQIARDTQRSLDRVERNQRSDFRWLLGIMLGGFALVLSAIGGLGIVLLPALHAIARG